MLNQILSLVVFMLSVVVWFIGCGFIGPEDMPVEKVGLLYVSENRPATVVIGVLGSHHDGCVDGAKVSADREGNTIYLSATKRVTPGFFGGCEQAVVDLYEEVSVRNLEVGEYKVMDGGYELLKFRIAADAGYVKSGPIVTGLKFTAKTADGFKVSPRTTGILFYESSEPLQVTMRVIGHFDSKCVPYLKTHIEREQVNQWIPVYRIYVDISGEVPIVNTERALRINTNNVYGNPSYSAEIDLGTFPMGWYTIVVSDSVGRSIHKSIKIEPDYERQISNLLN